MDQSIIYEEAAREHMSQPSIHDPPSEDSLGRLLTNKAKNTKNILIYDKSFKVADKDEPDLKRSIL